MNQNREHISNQLPQRSIESETVLAELERLHGHLGPFVVIGYRMGELALNALNAPKYFGPEAISRAGTRPPVSCMNDGIQWSTGCTFGKGNIKAIEEGIPAATFKFNGASVEIRLKPDAEASIKQWLERDGERTAAARVFEMPDADLFELNKPD